MIAALLRLEAQRQRRDNAGLTLIELIIVVFILGILAAIAYPAYASMTRRANYAEAKQQMGSLGKELQLHYVEYSTYPPDVNANTKPAAIVNWPTKVPFNSMYDYDHWRIGDGQCYVQIGFWGESGQRAYPVHRLNSHPHGFEEFGDNLVLGVAVYPCQSADAGPIR